MNYCSSLEWSSQRTTTRSAAACGGSSSGAAGVGAASTPPGARCACAGGARASARAAASTARGLRMDPPDDDRAARERRGGVGAVGIAGLAVVGERAPLPDLDPDPAAVDGDAHAVLAVRALDDTAGAGDGDRRRAVREQSRAGRL